MQLSRLFSGQANTNMQLTREVGRNVQPVAKVTGGDGSVDGERDGENSHRPHSVMAEECLGDHQDSCGKAWDI